LFWRVGYNANMTKRLFFLLAVLFLGACQGAAQSAETSPDCAVSDAYLEAVGENNGVLLNILVYSRIENSPLEDAATIPVFYANLTSMRHYHEQQRERLPACAQAHNTAMIDAISAAQDVLATRHFWNGNPDDARTQSRTVDAQADFVESWSRLSDVASTSVFVAVDCI